MIEILRKIKEKDSRKLRLLNKFRGDKTYGASKDAKLMRKNLTPHLTVF